MLRSDNINVWLMHRLIARVLEGASLGALGGFAWYSGLGHNFIDQFIAVTSFIVALSFLFFEIRGAELLFKEKKNIDGTLRGGVWENFLAVMSTGIAVLFMMYAYFGAFFSFLPK